MRHWLLSEASELFDQLGGLLDQFCWAGGCWAWAAALPASALLLTRLAKISFSGDGPAAGLANLGGVFWKDTFVAVSDVTLCTDGLSQSNPIVVQQGPGQSEGV
ncbi:hypothetical protein [Bradyrhizobium sp. dw_78]|uniref:hypothetical protein n=1 Tax=Bradyrhizobium sp. dw_78 TaxID=2719793 RepID=UPI001BD37073|nr:hypothetical protein [Bradyrhizobium sp. dw_78]